MHHVRPKTAEDFNAMPYHSMAYPASSPDRIAAVAHLFGQRVPDPARARVLELGCASGGNILPYAARFPEASVLGIDLSAGHVATGQARIAALGLKNAEIRHGDIETIDLSENGFDYLIAHGVWSWVSEAAQETIFALGQHCLVSGGLAYISYNTYPGWHMREIVRDLTAYHTGAQGTPQERVARARDLLQHFGHIPGNGLYGQLLRQEVTEGERQPDAYILAEYLADHNRPSYLHDFVARASGHGLSYISDADVLSSRPETLDKETARLVGDLAGYDRIAGEQYMDFVTARQFRQSILVNSSDDANTAPDLDLRKLRDLHLRSAWRRDPNTSGPARKQWKIHQGAREVTPTEDAVLAALHQAGPGSMPIRALLRDVAREIGVRRGEAFERLLALLFRMAFAPGLDLTCLPFRAGRASAPVPTVVPLARLEAEEGQPWVTSPRHAPISLSRNTAQIVTLFDGTRSRAQVVDLVSRRLTAGQGGAAHNPMVLHPDPAALQRQAEQIVDGLLLRLEEGGLLSR